MRSIRKRLELNKYDYHTVHLSIINAVLPIKLTPKEIEVLAAFMILDGDIGKDRFGTSARKIVMEKLNLSPGGLSNYIKSLTKKNFISNKKIHPIVIPNKDVQEYFFQIQNIENA